MVDIKRLCKPDAIYVNMSDPDWLWALPLSDEKPGSRSARRAEGNPLRGAGGAALPGDLPGGSAR